MSSAAADELFNTNIENSEMRRMLVDFPNSRAYAIDDSKLKTRYGERYKQLIDTPEYKNLPAKLDDIPVSQRSFIPQDDPRWLDMRKQPQLTGSVSAELLGFHDMRAATILNIPKMMHVDRAVDPFNHKWEELLMRVRHGNLPRTPMDPPGNVYCAGGKAKEANGLAYMMDSIGNMQFREVGAIDVGPEQLVYFKELVNVFENNAPIVSFPPGFKLVISPDGDITVPAKVFVDEDGDVVVTDSMDMALEMKTPTYFGCVDHQVKAKKDAGLPFFPGFEFYAKGRNCKPYEKPKEYYLTQCFLEMLALKRDACLFACATYAQGMRIWRIDMNQRYLSLTLSVLIFMYKRFVMNDKQVPTDYFLSFHYEHPHRIIYEELLNMTNAICKETGSNMYMEVAGTVTAKIATDIGLLSTESFVAFPNLPEADIPAYQLVCIYGRRLLLAYNRLTWPSKWRQLAEREANLTVLSNTRFTMFAKVVFANIADTLAKSGKFKEEIMKHDLVKHETIELKERFILALYKYLFELYGEEAFGVPLELEVFVHNIVRRAIALGKRLHIPSVAVCDLFCRTWTDNVVREMKKTHQSTCPWHVSSVGFLYDMLMDESVFNRDNEAESRTAVHSWQFERLFATLAVCL